MDMFEVEDSIDQLESRVNKLQSTLDSFINSFQNTLQEEMSVLIDCLSDSPSSVKDKDDYIIKLLCNLGYGQSCILENQKKIIELLGGRTVGIRSMSMDEKKRRIEKTLNELQDPYRGGKVTNGRT